MTQSMKENACGGGGESTRLGKVTDLISQAHEKIQSGSLHGSRKTPNTGKDTPSEFLQQQINQAMTSYNPIKTSITAMAYLNSATLKAEKD